MSSLQSVTVRQKLFVGGGVASSLIGDDYEHTVYEYDEDSNQWVSLPLYDCQRFAMTILTDKLTLVGGFNPYPWKVTNQVAVWEGEGTSWGWTHPYPPMTTPRYSPAIATYGDRLVVAGGRKSLLGDALATVEVLNTTSHQWLSASPLPVGCCNMKSAIVNQELFLLGGLSTSVSLVVSLPDITQSIVPSATTNKSAQWRTLPAPPLKDSAAISLCGSVLAIGGLSDNERSTAIHIYQPATNNWSKVGDLPSPLSSCSCALLSSGHILVAGGYDSNGKRTSRVDVATL